MTALQYKEDLLYSFNIRKIFLTHSNSESTNSTKMFPSQKSKLSYGYGKILEKLGMLFILTGLQSSRKKDPNTSNHNAFLKRRHLKYSFDIMNL